jgi:hypothetical protein
MPMSDALYQQALRNILHPGESDTVFSREPPCTKAELDHVTKRLATYKALCDKKDALIADLQAQLESTRERLAAAYLELHPNNETLRARLVLAALTKATVDA